MIYKDWLRTSKCLFLRRTDNIDDSVLCHAEGAVWLLCLSSLQLNPEYVTSIRRKIDAFWYSKTFIAFKRYPIKTIHITRNLRSILINDIQEVKPTDTIRMLR